MPTPNPSAASSGLAAVAARGEVTLTDLAALPARVAQLQAQVAEPQAKVNARSEAEALLDVAGAAQMLHMTPAAVRAAAYRGSLPCVRVESRSRFRPSELLPS